MGCDYHSSALRHCLRIRAATPAEMTFWVRLMGMRAIRDSRPPDHPYSTAVRIERLYERTGQSVLYLPVDLSMRAECMHEKKKK